MKIIEDIKLDFKDVLLVPQRSDLESRADVDLEREVEFIHSKRKWKGIPIIAANMDTVGTFQMARELQKYKMLTALHKHYSDDQLIEFFQDKDYWDYTFYTVGSSTADYNKLIKVRDAIGKGFPHFICIDVPNGYAQSFIGVVQKYRKEFPTSVIMAGNVVTANMSEELILSGADIVKVGIGSGCFHPECKVLTDDGLIPITQIKVGDRVLTHKGVYQKVTGTTSRHAETLLSINGIKCTHNHEFYTVHKRELDAILDDELPIPQDDFMEWIPAERLTKDHFIYDLKKGFLAIDEIKEIEFNGQVYDLEVESDHSYNIGGVVVHNSVCTTRIHTRVGMPQVSAIDECAFAVHGKPRGHVCSDGGCTNSGDVSIAFATGADFTMLGGMLAGTDACEGEWIENNGEKKLRFYGMSSKDAQEKFYGGMKHYRAAEGKTVEVNYKGSVKEVVDGILGGIRSTCTYIGAKRIKDMPKCACFVKVARTHNTVFGDNH